MFLNATNLNITEGDSTLLKCTIRSMVPFTVWIQHEQMPLKEQNIKYKYFNKYSHFFFVEFIIK